MLNASTYESRNYNTIFCILAASRIYNIVDLDPKGFCTEKSVYVMLL